MADDAEIALRVLKRNDERICDILASASEVVLYQFNPNDGKNGQWAHMDFEGGLYVFRRTSGGSTTGHSNGVTDGTVIKNKQTNGVKVNGSKILDNLLMPRVIEAKTPKGSRNNKSSRHSISGVINHQNHDNHHIHQHKKSPLNQFNGHHPQIQSPFINGHQNGHHNGHHESTTSPQSYKYGFYVLNKKAKANLREEILINQADLFETSSSSPFLLYKNKDHVIRCMWFHSPQDFERIRSCITGLEKGSLTNGQGDHQSEDRPQETSKAVNIIEMLKQGRERKRTISLSDHRNGFNLPLPGSL